MKHEITLLVSENSKYQPEFFGKVAEGLRRHGVTVRLHEKGGDPKTPVVACWGWRRGKPLFESGHRVLVFERGYLGDRFHWSSIAWNGLNGNADFCLPDKISSLRFDENFEMKPWQKPGKKIIIMGQVKGDMSLRGQDLTAFYEEAARQASAYYNLPVFFRLHPAGIASDRNFKPNLPLIYDDFEQVLAQAAFVITYNSNAAVDAVIRGVPALSFDAGSMAYEVTGHSVADIITPAREAWARKLAYCQWTPEEIANGDYWERMKCRLEA